MTNNDLERKILDYLEGDLSPEEERELLLQTDKDSEAAVLLEQYREQDRRLKKYFGAFEPALNSIRRPDIAEASPTTKVIAIPPSGAIVIARWAAAVACVALLALVTTTIIVKKKNPMAAAMVLASAGVAQLFGDEGIAAADAQTSIGNNIHGLKTGNNGYMQVALPRDAGQFEINSNSLVRIPDESKPELYVDRGEVLVRAEQAGLKKDGATRVKTPQFEAESKDGTFSVVRGLRGSEVSVLSGEVELTQGGARRVLKAGDSFSSEGADTISVVDRVQWVPDREALLMQLASLQAEDTGAEHPSLITSSSPSSQGRAPAPTTDYLPKGTIGLIELPNISSLLAPLGADSIDDFMDSPDMQKVIHNALANQMDDARAQQVAQLVSSVLSMPDVRTIAGAMKNSVSIGMGRNGVVLIADVREDNEAVADAINNRINPMIQGLAAGTELEDQPLLAVVNGFLVAGEGGDFFNESVNAIREQSPTDFIYSPFLMDLRNTTPSSRFTAALNVSALAALAEKNDSKILERIGLNNMRSVIAATDFGDQANNQALRCVFEGQREGVIGWLAEPGSMGSLRFYSPDTNFLMTMKVQSPQAMLDQVLSWLQQDGTAIELPESQAQLALVRQAASSLGNEVAVGVDNPLLPLPNVKVAIEVVDPVKFHNTMLQLIDLMWKSDSKGKDVRVAAATYREHLIVDFEYPGAPCGISYAIIDDFVVFGPGRAFVVNAIDLAEDHHSIDREPVFMKSLPARSGSHVSFMTYFRLHEQLQQVMPMLQKFSPQQINPEKMEEIVKATEGAGLVAYGIADSNRIDFFCNGIRVGDFDAAGLIPRMAEWYKPLPGVEMKLEGPLE